MSKQFSIEEVSNHKTKESMWIVMNNKVYDITNFLEEHPGGDDVLLEKGGMDATQAFDDIGHSKEAIEQVNNYYIGDLVII